MYSNKTFQSLSEGTVQSWAQDKAERNKKLSTRQSWAQDKAERKTKLSARQSWA